ncbi:MAG: addiction module protein, partial [Candidatus Atribacteria bacterium]|nr:addiction module protein [Candidatus Atribacteria bacterium]
MSLLQNIQELPKNEKLVIMEYLWKDLFEENDEFESPEWH